MLAKRASLLTAEQRQAMGGRGGMRGMAPSEDARLRAEIRRLEVQIEALRRRIR